ncbi:MAG: ABC transporter substrate-binding protein [Clostridiales bacterium]|nr:ABC transporter substrate-binding protein [Clostridiales bacterium]
MKRQMISLLTAAALTLSLAAGTGGSENSTASGEDLTPVSLVLDWTPNTNHTGFYVAQKLGYYKEAGLDVEIQLPPEGSAPAFVAAGGADFGINAQDTLAPALVGEDALPITAVAALIQHNTSGLISLAEDGIESPKDLEGKVYATWDNPVEQAIIRTIMEADGGDFSKLTMVPSTVADVITALNTNIDTVWIFYAWDGVATQVKGYDTNYLDLAQLDPVFDYYTPVLIANNNFLAEEPETAKAFLAATAKGYQYAIDHPEEAAEILLEASPELDRDIVLASQQWLTNQYIADADRWGYIDPARWDAFYAWLTENQLVEGELPAGTGYSNDYLA